MSLNWIAFKVEPLKLLSWNFVGLARGEAPQLLPNCGHEKVNSDLANIFGSTLWQDVSDEPSEPRLYLVAESLSNRDSAEYASSSPRLPPQGAYAGCFHFKYFNTHANKLKSHKQFISPTQTARIIPETHCGPFWMPAHRVRAKRVY